MLRLVLPCSRTRESRFLEIIYDSSFLLLRSIKMIWQYKIKCSQLVLIYFSRNTNFVNILSKNILTVNNRCLNSCVKTQTTGRNTHLSWILSTTDDKCEIYFAYFLYYSLLNWFKGIFSSTHFKLIVTQNIWKFI